MLGSPETPRRSVRLLAKQLYNEEILEALSPAKPKTPERSQLDPQPKHTVTHSSARKLRNDTDERMTVESDTAFQSEHLVRITPPSISMHRHFIDSRQLDRPHSATDDDTSPVMKTRSVTRHEMTPVRKTPLRSPSRHESVRRSPRLSAMHDNLMEPAATAAKTNVGPVYTMSYKKCHFIFDHNSYV